MLHDYDQDDEDDDGKMFPEGEELDSGEEEERRSVTIQESCDLLLNTEEP